MSEKNKEIVLKILDVFSNNHFSEFINYLDNNISWNIVGLPVIKGKCEFIKAVYSFELENFSSSNIKNIISEGEYVVVESTAKSNLSSNKNETPAYCDIYRFKDNKIFELTTYLVDTSANFEKYT